MVRFVPDGVASAASIGINNQQRVSTDETNEEWMVLAVVAHVRRGCVIWAAAIAQAEAEAFTIFLLQRQRQVRRQRQLRGGNGCLKGQLASAAIYQHGQLNAGRAAKVENFVQRGPNGAACVQYVINQQNMGAIHHKRQRGLLGAAQAALGKVVAVHGGRDGANAG